MLRGVTGPLRADTGGGTLLAQDVAAATATVTTGGGPAMVTFAAVPESVSVSTDGGPVILAVPGGPYAVAADSDGGPAVGGDRHRPGRPSHARGLQRRRPAADQAG